MREDNYIPLYMRAPLIAQRRGPRNGAFVNDPEAFLSEPRRGSMLLGILAAGNDLIIDGAILMQDNVQRHARANNLRLWANPLLSGNVVDVNVDVFSLGCARHKEDQKQQSAHGFSPAFIVRRPGRSLQGSKVRTSTIAPRDRPDADIAVVDVPAFLAGIGRSATGEGGHAVLKRDSAG